MTAVTHSIKENPADLSHEEGYAPDNEARAGVEHGVPARLGATASFSPSGVSGEITAMTDQLCVIRDGKGLEHAERWGHVEVQASGPAADSAGLTGERPATVYHLALRLGREVVAHGDNEYEGVIVGMSPAGCLVETEGGTIVGADWQRIDLKIDFDDDGVDGRAQDPPAPTTDLFPVTVGDIVWLEDEGGTETREVLAVYPTHAVLSGADNDEEGEEVEAGWDKVLVYAHHAARNVARKLGKTPYVPAEHAADLGGDPAHDKDDDALGGKLTGMMHTVKIGDVLQGTSGINGDYIEGRILSVCQHGVFMEGVEKTYKGEIFGSTWEGLVVHPDAKTGVFVGEAVAS